MIFFIAIACELANLRHERFRTLTVNEHLKASELLVAISVERDVHSVVARHQRHPGRGQLRAAHPAATQAH